MGATDGSVGDFTTLLLTVNPSFAGGYPEDWTPFSASLSGLGGPATGRYAFRYFVPNTDTNADYIGIDTSASRPCPSPGTLLLVATGGVALSVVAGRSDRRPRTGRPRNVCEEAPDKSRLALIAALVALLVATAMS